jgi:hypothetical protein
VTKPKVRWQGDRITMVDFGHDCIATGPFIVLESGELRANCACWKTGRFIRVEGCEGHPYDL